MVSKVKCFITSQWMNKPQHRTWSDSLLSSGFLSRLVDSSSVSDEGTDYKLLEEEIF